MDRYCAFADDYPTWMDSEEGERERQDALPDPLEEELDEMFALEEELDLIG